MVTQEASKFGDMLRTHNASLVRGKLQYDVRPEALNVVGVRRQDVAVDHLLSPTTKSHVAQSAVLPARQLLEQLVSPRPHRTSRRRGIILDQRIKLGLHMTANRVSLELMEQALLEAVPRDSNSGFDMRAIIHMIVDKESFFEI